MLNTRWVAAASTVLLAATVPLGAHHSLTAEYDPNKKITLSGTITRVDWSNPHSFLTLDVTPENGKTETWRVEVGSPNQLLSVKLTRDMLDAGAKVVIEGVVSKDGLKKAAGNSLTFPGNTATFYLMVPLRKPRPVFTPVDDPYANLRMYVLIISVPVLVLALGLLILRRQRAAAAAAGAKAE